MYECCVCGESVGELGSALNGRGMSMEVKRYLRNSIVVPMLAYGSEVWKWNGAEQSKIRAVEMMYLRAVIGVTVLLYYMPVCSC